MSNWIFEKQYTYCSNCNVTTERITPYCPWCGEIMENFRGPPAICDYYHIEPAVVEQKKEKFVPIMEIKKI